MGGDLCLEPRTDQTSAGPGRGQLAGVFQIVEEGQMHRARFVERSKTLDRLISARGIDQMRLCQRGQIGQRRQSGVLEKYRLAIPPVAVRPAVKLRTSLRRRT